MSADLPELLRSSPESRWVLKPDDAYSPQSGNAILHPAAGVIRNNEKGTPSPGGATIDFRYVIRDL